MVIAVLSDDLLKAELSPHLPPHVEVVWADSIRALRIIDADVYFDLAFQFNPDRIEQLSRLLPKPVVVNSVVYTTKDIGHPFIRINAWPTMLQGPSAELAVANPGDRQTAAHIFEALQWPHQFVPDITGMIKPRLIALAANEAIFIGEKDSTGQAGVDAVMRTTGWPFGPVEWAERIGLDRIFLLLTELRRSDSRYTIAPALTHAANGPHSSH